MPNTDPSDTELLDDWLRHRREPAFHALVGRYQGLVHAAALRRCGDESIAAEATQLSFISLAQKAKSLRSRSTLIGWLHLTAVFHTRNLVRHQQRETRKRQLLQTHMDTQIPAPDTWLQMQPVIDEALAALSSQDRETLLLRFYRALSVREIASVQSIATDAAQKRLDRATERMRLQLTRRGCAVGGTLSAVMLAGFTTDAQAILPSTAAIATKAIAAASTTTALTTTLGLIIMTKKATLTTAAVLLLAGAGAIAISKRDDSSATKTTSNPIASANHPDAESNGNTSASARASKSKPRGPARYSELVSKYGESRTNLSKQVATNFIGLMDDTIGMGEISSDGGPKAAERARRSLQRKLGTLGSELNLTDEQQAKAAALYTEYRGRRRENLRDSAENLKQDPSSLMHALLASDAYSRGKITEDEYLQNRAEATKNLKGVINPFDRKNFTGGNPKKDEIFNREFQALLDPTQVGIYQAAVTAEQVASKENNDSEDTSTRSAMDLEELDESLASVKKLTGGLKQLKEGIKGIKEEKTK